MCGITTIDGCAIPQSSEIWPTPRIPISVIRTSVSGSRRHTVSGRPISLFRLFSAQIVDACGAHNAPRMSFVVVFPAEPTTATTCASLRETDEQARSRRALAPGRRGRASPRLARAPRRRSRTPVFSATKRSPGPTSRESALIAVISPRRPRARPSCEPCDLVERNRDHARLRIASRATSRSSKGVTTPATS